MQLDTALEMIESLLQEHWAIEYNFIPERHIKAWEIVENAAKNSQPTTCEYCAMPILECLKKFEICAFADTHLQMTPINEKGFFNLNDGIKWAKSIGADFIEVYQGCDKENQILQLNLSEKKNDPSKTS